MAGTEPKPSRVLPLNSRESYVNSLTVMLGDALRRVGGFEPPAESELAFTAVRTRFVRTKPAREGLEGEKLQAWRDAIAPHGVGSLEAGLWAAHYHRKEVVRLENEVEQIAKDNVTVVKAFAPGSMSVEAPPLTFEYAAFLLARRRTLDYLAGFVARFFAFQCQSIRDLGKTMRKLEEKGQLAPAALAEPVMTRYEAEYPSLRLTEGQDKDARDLTAHYRSVSAGVFGLRTHEDRTVEVSLIGGGEEIGLPTPEGPPTRPTPKLSAVLADRLRAAERLLFGFFVDLDLLAPEEFPPHLGRPEPLVPTSSQSDVADSK